MASILIVDDDAAIAGLISDALADEGFETTVELDGEAALRRIERGEGFELILMDIMMPHMDGLTLCRRIREQVGCPIVFVTAKSRTLDAMVGLEMGADDYIFKPFKVEELVARVKAHIRREQRSELKHRSSEITVGDLSLNPESFEVRRAGQPVSLSTREFQLLHYLMQHAGRVLSREQLFNAVWGLEYRDMGTVAVNIKALRDKLDPDNRYIKTVWGMGYKFVHPEE